MHWPITPLIPGIALAAILTLPVPAITQTPAQKAGDAAETIKGYTIEKKNEAVAHGKKLVSDLDVKIKDLESRISRDTSSAKADLQRQLSELKAKRAQAGKKLDELGKATAESWDSVKHGFADAYKDLQTAFDKAAANLRK
jgi:DNA repair exonuclease SbcCD ATPase subunit